MTYEPEGYRIVPSGRIDYCSNCDSEHGYDCPKDKPEVSSLEERFDKELGNGKKWEVMYDGAESGYELPTEGTINSIKDFIKIELEKARKDEREKIKVTKPENWDNWTLERQLGFNMAIEAIRKENQ